MPRTDNQPWRCHIWSFRGLSWVYLDGQILSNISEKEMQYWTYEAPWSVASSRSVLLMLIGCDLLGLSQPNLKMLGIEMGSNAQSQSYSPVLKYKCYARKENPYDFSRKYLGQWYSNWGGVSHPSSSCKGPLIRLGWEQQCNSQDCIAKGRWRGGLSLTFRSQKLWEPHTALHYTFQGLDSSKQEIAKHFQENISLGEPCGGLHGAPCISWSLLQPAVTKRK